MLSYGFRKALIRLVVGAPVPRALDRVVRFYARTRAGEGFGDVSINGELRFLRAHAPACRVIFDVGAQEGGWTEHALRVNPGAEVHCFEPMRASFQQLTQREWAGRVVCNQLGLSDREGEAEMHVASTSLHERRLLLQPPSAEGPVETVRLTTLSAYCAAHGIEQIDLLKIDAEGHDLAVLRGGEAMVRAGRIRRIQFEYGPWNIYARVLLRDFYAFFHGLPYVIYQVTPRGMVPYPAYEQHLENFHYKNFVALHRDVAD
ncbi:MAG TPA: FkbM family methyltransferase [Longimicrobiaceae bacterium]|nr:FkbM family methyltransferase [Longimicrobiaceae bacterium]